MADGLSSDADNSEGQKAKVKGKEMSWPQLVKKLGQKGAAQAAPELDPRYQKLVATEGQAKGSADYSHSVEDPNSVSAKGWAGLGSPEQINEGIKSEKARGGLLAGTSADIGDFIMSAGGLKGSNIGQAIFGGGSNDPGGKGGKGGKGGGDNSAAVQKYLESQDAKSKEVSPAVGLMNSLVGQYQAEMGVVNPYMNGSVASQDGALAQQMGASIGGPTQPAPAAGVAANAALKTDAQNYTTANQAGASGIQSALKDTGTADADALRVSPYLGLLSALQSEATYKQETAAAGGAGLAEPAGAPSFYTNALKILNASSPTSTGGASAPGTQPPSGKTDPSTDTTVTAGGGNG